jgi:phosphate transport system protein
MAATVEAALARSVRALCDGQPPTAADVKADEQRIDRWEVRIEQECLRILALYGPVASDLRRVAVVLRINADLERIADLAEHVAKRTRKLVREGGLPIPRYVGELGESSLALVREGLNALGDADPAHARAVIAADKKVDRALRSALKQMKLEIQQDPERVDAYLRVMNTARDLERAADHAANIAKAIVFLIEGDIIRHTRATTASGEVIPPPQSTEGGSPAAPEG